MMVTVIRTLKIRILNTHPLRKRLRKDNCTESNDQIEPTLMDISFESETTDKYNVPRMKSLKMTRKSKY